MDKLFLRNELITGNTLTQDGVLAYIALRTLIDESIPLYNRTSSMDCISVNRLAYSLIGEMDYEKALTDSLQRGIYELAGGEWISIRKDLSTNKSYEYVLDLEKIWLDTEKDKFTVVFPADVYKIMTCNEKMDKRIRMLKYYVALVSTFDWSLDSKIGHMSQEYIAEQADTSIRTCQRYNDILVDMQMIYVYKSNDKVRDDYKLKQIKNCYSRYEDKGICEQYASNYENMYGVEHKIVQTKKNKEQADNNRRLAQIYNRICDGHADDYDEATIKKVRNYIVNKNKTLYEKYDDAVAKGYTGEDYLDQIKDEDIFEQFDFLKSVPKVSEGTDEWGEPDPMLHDFSVEEILDMPTMGEVQMNPTKCEVHSEPTKEDKLPWKTDSDLQSKGDKPKMDSETDTPVLASRNDLDLIDIESLFDEDTDDRPVLSQEEAWELFA